MAGASWVNVSDQSPTSSAQNLSGATGSFNYTGPVVNLPAVQASRDFWQRDSAAAAVASVTGSAVNGPSLLLLAAGALLAVLLLRKGR